MSDTSKESIKACRRSLTFAFSTVAVVVLAGAIPKDETPAATSRLALALVTSTVTIVGIGGFLYNIQRYRHARRQRRFGPASSAVRDTLSYLHHEQTLAHRGQAPALLASLSFATAHVTAHWPQAAILAPYKTAFGVLAIATLALLPILALRQRGHMINALFLRRYLKQQIDHLGYRPRRRKKHDAQNSEGNIEVLGSLRFRAAGFEFSFDDFVTNTVIFGQTGSGKTISILNTLLDGLIASSAKDELPISGIVLDAKGDFFGKLQNLCKRYGRENDLVILDPEAWKEHAETFKSIAWNPLDNDDDALEVATRLIAVLKMLGLEIGNEGTFFMDSAKAYLRHTIALIRAARLTPAPSLVDVYRLCQEDEKETPFYHEVIRAISARYPDEVPQTIKDAIIYMEKEWAPITDRQKSAIKGTLTQLLDEFLIAPLRDILTRPSTISIGDGIDTGKIFYIRIPVDDRTRMSRIVNTLLKLEYQRKVLQRRKKQRPSFMMCDEFQTLYTSGDGSGDSDFFERSRESNHANFVATQNLQAFLKRTRNDHDVKNFISNCALKIFLRNTDEETNRFASGLFGTRSEIVINTSEQAAFNGGWSKRRHTSYSRATRLLPCVSADAFMRLAIPVKSDPKNREAEAVVHLASRGETEHVTLFWPVHPLE